MSAQVPTIKIGSIAPDGVTKLVDLTKTQAIISVGSEAKEMNISFSDCEKIWGV